MCPTLSAMRSHMIPPLPNHPSPCALTSQTPAPPAGCAQSRLPYGHTWRHWGPAAAAAVAAATAAGGTPAGMCGAPKRSSELRLDGSSDHTNSPSFPAVLQDLLASSAGTKAQAQARWLKLRPGGSSPGQVAQAQAWWLKLRPLAHYMESTEHRQHTYEPHTLPYPACTTQTRRQN